MNTIGLKKDNSKLYLSLDEIIRQEPQRYTATLANNNVGVKELTHPSGPHQGWKRPPLYGRLEQRNNNPQGNKNMKNRNGHLNSFALDRQGFKEHSQKRRAAKGKPNEASPFDHNTFTFNGVHVSGNSALLNRGVGEVGIISYTTEQETDYPNVHVNSKRSPQVEVPGKRFNDMTYVRQPVHERLGWTVKERGQQLTKYLKKRVSKATKLLRQRDRQQVKQQGVMSLLDMSFELTKSGQPIRRILEPPRKVIEQKFQSKRLLKNKQFQAKKVLAHTHRQRNQMRQQDGQVRVSIVNDLALEPQMKTQNQAQILFNSDGTPMFVAPLSRQNVAQLPGTNGISSPVSSHISSASMMGMPRTSQELMQDQIAAIQQVQQMQMMNQFNPNSSLVNGYMPMMNGTGSVINVPISNGMSMTNNMMPMGSGAITMVPMPNGSVSMVSMPNGSVPMMPMSGRGVPMMPMGNGVMGMGGAPMNMMMGGVQPYMQTLNMPSTLHYVPETSPKAFQTHKPRKVIARPDGSILVQGPSSPFAFNAQFNNPRSPTFIQATSQQQLDNQMQRELAEVQAQARHRLDRRPPESFNYKPRAKATQHSTDKRFSGLAPNYR